ncbi:MULTISPECIES: hypothetical protein [unclassified Streptomyces]|uniref:hypothetical protein n=1 Tax=unclassified Streptomyces TaxID=2593676 RepID=UPI002E1148D9|nr:MULTISPECIES: hypothetical protein [unclassified Streptomyces]WSR23826.1 hypothetical protein OG573_35385 [Streptomyces sp. NBC_01205]
MHNARSDGEAELAEKALAPVLALCEEERAAILAEGTYGPAPPSTALPPFPQLEGTLAPAPDTVRAAVYVARHSDSTSTSPYLFASTPEPLP